MNDPSLAHSDLDSDENGFTLILLSDEDERPTRMRVGYEEGRQLLASLAPLREWVAEGDAERRAYDAASTEERDRVLGRAAPTIDEAAELLRHAADLDRKAARENP